MTAAQLKTLLEATIHCLFTNKLLIATLHYDAFDLEGWAVGVAVMVTITIVQASRWETFQNNEIVRKVTPILQWCFPADCHVSRKSRLPRNDTLITYYHSINRFPPNKRFTDNALTRTDIQAKLRSRKGNVKTIGQFLDELLQRGDI